MFETVSSQQQLDYKSLDTVGRVCHSCCVVMSKFECELCSNGFGAGEERLKAVASSLSALDLNCVADLDGCDSLNEELQLLGRLCVHFGTCLYMDLTLP